MKNLITDFSFGEISRSVDGRVDLAAYHKSCAEMRNMYVQPFGMASRMPGTEYICSMGAAADNNDTRLVPFWKDESESFVLVFTTGRLYSLRNGEKDLEPIESADYEMTDNAVSGFQFVQIDDWLFYCHEDIGLFGVLYSDGSFSLRKVDIPEAQVSDRTIQGNPSCITTYGRRLIVGGFSDAPTYYRASKAGQPTDFTVGTADTDGFISEITAGGDFSGIRWIAASDGLIFGTATAEIVVPDTDGIGLTPSGSYFQQRVSSFGSARFPAAQLGLSLVFLGRNDSKLREYAYTTANGASASPDLTVLADHILEDGVKQLSCQLSPHESLFVLRKTGSIGILTYSRDGGVTAWSQLETDGFVESIATVPGEDQDYTYITVKRKVMDVEYRYIERYSSYRKTDGREWVFSDSCMRLDFGSAEVTAVSDDGVVTAPEHGFSAGDYVTFTFRDGVFRIKEVTADTFTLQTENFRDVDASGWEVRSGTALRVGNRLEGLQHLAGKECSVLADGGVTANVTVGSDGTAVLQRKANLIQIGLVSRAYIKTNRIAPELLGEKRNVNKVHIRFFRTLGCRVSSDGSDSQVVSFRGNELDLSAPELFTGDKSIYLSDRYSTDGYIYISQTEALPLNICAVSADFTTGGR